MSAAGNVVIDTCTLENFVVVDALGLLGERLGTRARWTETIRIEVTRGIRAEPRLRQVLQARWLGDPLEIGEGPGLFAGLTRSGGPLAEHRPSPPVTGTCAEERS